MLDQNNSNQSIHLHPGHAEESPSFSGISINLHLALKYGIYLTLSFIGVFLIARITGLSRFTECRFINYLLFFPIGFAAVKKTYQMNNNSLEYFNGLAIGFLTVMSGQLMYAILFYIYLSVDQPFLQYIVSQMPKPLYYPKLSICGVLIIEGLGASSILSLTLMQYFKWKRGRWAFKK